MCHESVKLGATLRQKLLQIFTNDCDGDDFDNVYIVAAAAAATLAAVAAEAPAAATEAGQAHEGAGAASVAAAPDAHVGEHLAAVAPETGGPAPLQGQAASPAAPTQVPQTCLLFSIWVSSLRNMSLLPSSSDAGEVVCVRMFPAGCVHHCCSERP